MALPWRAQCCLDSKGQFLCRKLAQAWKVDSGEWVGQEEFRYVLGLFVFLVLIPGIWEERPAQNNGRSQALPGLWGGVGMARTVLLLGRG